MYYSKYCLHSNKPKLWCHGLFGCQDNLKSCCAKLYAVKLIVHYQNNASHIIPCFTYIKLEWSSPHLSSIWSLNLNNIYTQFFLSLVPLKRKRIFLFCSIFFSICSNLHTHSNNEHYISRRFTSNFHFDFVEWPNEIL